MRKFALFLAVGVLGFVPAAIAFGDDSPSSTTAQKQCATQQADANFASAHGGKTFVQFYGANSGQQNAFGKCVSTIAKASSGNSTSTETTTTTSHVSPSAACRADRAADEAAFKAKWAKKHGKGTAFGKCVAAKAAAQHTTA